MFFNKKKAKIQPKAMMAAASAPAEASEPSYLGRDAVLDGQLICEGEIHIDGTLRGSLRARVCVIDLHGVVQGEVTGDVIHVRGRVIGPLQGSQVYIHAGAHVEGDVFHDTISIENGAFVYGTVRHNAAQIPQQSAFQPPAAPPQQIAVDTQPLQEPMQPLSEKDKLLNRLRLVQNKK